MKTYNVTIEETLARTVSVHAENTERAIDIVRDAHNNERIMLDAADFVEVNITDIQEASENELKEPIL